MTISTTTSRQSYNGNGVTTIFSVPFRFFANADLVVQLVTISTGAATTLTLTTHYTVTGADEEAGGSLTMLTAPAVGERIVIRRVIAATQEVDYVAGDSFPAETHERALDRLTMLVQQQDEITERALMFPAGDTASGELPVLSARAGRLLGFDSSGDLTVSAPASGSAAELALDLASTATGKGAEMVGFKQSGVSAVDRTSDQKHKETRTPADFSSTQSFLDASTLSGAVFIVPPGTYNVTATLKVPSDSRIHWTRGAVLMAANGLNADVLQNADTASGNSGISWTGHCKIDGNYLNQTGGNGITFDKVTDSDFGVFEANNCKGHGILFSECDRNTIKDIRAKSNGKTQAAYGAYFYNSSDNEVDRARVDDNCIGIAVEASGAGKSAVRNTLCNVKARNNRADYSQSGAGVHFEEGAGGNAGDNVVIYPDCRGSTGVGINLTDVDNIKIIEPVLRDNGKSGLTALQSLNIQIIGGEAIGNAATEGAGYRAQMRFDDSGLTGCTGTVIGLKASGSENAVKTFSSGCAMRFVACDLTGTVAPYNLSGAGDNVAGLDANGYSIDAKKPVMKAGKTTGQSSAGVIVCDSELIDTRGMYNTGTGVLTIPTTGIYMLSALATDASGARLVIRLRKNGAVFAEATNVGGAATESSAAIPATFIQANAGDTVDLYLAAGTTAAGSEKTYIAAVHVA